MSEIDGDQMTPNPHHEEKDEAKSDGSVNGSITDASVFPTFHFLPNKFLKRRWAQFNKQKQLEVLVEWKDRDIKTWEPYKSLVNTDLVEDITLLPLEIEDEKDGEHDTEDEREEGTYDVEKILYAWITEDCDIEYFFIKWEHYPINESTWGTEDHFSQPMNRDMEEARRRTAKLERSQRILRAKWNKLQKQKIYDEKKRSKLSGGKTRVPSSSILVDDKGEEFLAAQPRRRLRQISSGSDEDEIGPMQKKRERKAISSIVVSPTTSKKRSRASDTPNKPSKRSKTERKLKSKERLRASRTKEILSANSVVEHLSSPQTTTSSIMPSEKSSGIGNDKKFVEISLPVGSTIPGESTSETQAPVIEEESAYTITYPMKPAGRDKAIPNDDFHESQSIVESPQSVPPSRVEPPQLVTVSLPSIQGFAFDNIDGSPQKVSQTLRDILGPQLDPDDPAVLHTIKKLVSRLKSVVDEQPSTFNCILESIVYLASALERHQETKPARVFANSNPACTLVSALPASSKVISAQTVTSPFPETESNVSLTPDIIVSSPVTNIPQTPIGDIPPTPTTGISVTPTHIVPSVSVSSAPVRPTASPSPTTSVSSTVIPKVLHVASGSPSSAAGPLSAVNSTQASQISTKPRYPSEEKDSSVSTCLQAQEVNQPSSLQGGSSALITPCAPLISPLPPSSINVAPRSAIIEPQESVPTEISSSSSALQMPLHLEVQQGQRVVTLDDVRRELSQRISSNERVREALQKQFSHPYVTQKPKQIGRFISSAMPAEQIRPSTAQQRRGLVPERTDVARYPSQIQCRESNFPLQSMQQITPLQRDQIQPLAHLSSQRLMVQPALQLARQSAHRPNVPITPTRRPKSQPLSHHIPQIVQRSVVYPQNQPRLQQLPLAQLQQVGQSQNLIQLQRQNDLERSQKFAQQAQLVRQQQLLRFISGHLPLPHESHFSARPLGFPPFVNSPAPSPVTSSRPGITGQITVAPQPAQIGFGPITTGMAQITQSFQILAAGMQPSTGFPERVNGSEKSHKNLKFLLEKRPICGVEIVEPQLWAEMKLRSKAVVNGIALEKPAPSTRIKLPMRCYCAKTEPLPSEQKARIMNLLRHSSKKFFDFCENGVPCTICLYRDHIDCALSWASQVPNDMQKFLSELKSFGDSYICVACRIIVVEPLSQVEKVLALNVSRGPGIQSPMGNGEQTVSRKINLEFFISSHFTDDLIKGSALLQIRGFEVKPYSYRFCGYPHQTTFFVNNHTPPSSEFIIKPPPQFRKRKEVPWEIPLQRLHLPGNNSITVEMQYLKDQSTACYMFAVVLVKQTTPEIILKAVNEGSVISRGIAEGVCAAILREASKQTEDEVQTIDTSHHVTLTCPSTLMRINIPGRGFKCKHTQCFDVQYYIESQPRINSLKHRWKCPVCDQPIFPFELFIDKYFESILQETNENDKKAYLDTKKLNEVTWRVTETSQPEDEDMSNDTFGVKQDETTTGPTFVLPRPELEPTVVDLD